MYTVRSAKVDRTATTYDSVEQLAAELGISRATAYVGLRNGTIPAIRLGKRFVIPRAAISEWLRNAGKEKA